MTTEIDMLIRKKYRALRKSEQKVADCILQGDFEIDELNIKDLAEIAEVSQPTVIRFANAIGFKGFKEMKNELIREEVSVSKNNIKELLMPAGLTSSDNLEDIPLRIISMNIKQMENTLKNISPKDLEKTVDYIVKGRKVVIAAAEHSCATAEDFSVKLAYLGINAVFYQDVYRQNMCATNLKKEDVLIGISYSGVSATTVSAMKRAKMAGASTIAITNFAISPISKYADIVLSGGNDQNLYGSSLFSRCSQLALVDMIYAGIMLTDFEKYAREVETKGLISDSFAIKND